jgi:citronellol/citronellal dehydrogenase
MANSLDGRVAIVTGSTRGIGRDLVLRLARAGAKVDVTGKSETDSPNLPGSIYSVAEEVRALGGEALPVRVDVRDESDVQGMVEQTIEAFGRVDILVNNAGALWWESVVDTPPKRVRLMFDVNLAGAYLATYYCLPHMVRGGWGHVIMNSPPIVKGPTPGQAMYAATKMGMTRLAISVAEEHQTDGIASNSLWPATPIDSYATRNWPSDKMGVPAQWRTSEIYCDAVMELVGTEPPSVTAQQLVDESFLRARGWSDDDIGRYWLHGQPPENPMWIDDAWFEAPR